jgi:hypothetical protein
MGEVSQMDQSWGTENKQITETARATVWAIWEIERWSRSVSVCAGRDALFASYFRFFCDAEALPWVYSFRGLEVKLSGQHAAVQSGTILALPYSRA